MTGTTAQALFSRCRDGVVSIDLVVLEPLTWGTVALPRGMPITVSMRVPGEVAESISVITDRWATDCQVLRVGLHGDAASETVLLDGPDEQLVLEVSHPAPDL